MTIQEFKDKLVDNLTVSVYHILAAPEDECPVLCWQQLPGRHLYGDDAVAANVLQVQLDYFTTTEYDPMPGSIEAVLMDLDVCGNLEELTFDPQREEWRFIWTVEWLGDAYGENDS